MLTVKRTGRRVVSILRFFLPPRESQAVFIRCQFLETCGIKQMKIERTWETGVLNFSSVFFMKKSFLNIFFRASSICSRPLRISSVVEVLNIIEALCITHKSFNKRIPLSFSALKKSRIKKNALYSIFWPIINNEGKVIIKCWWKKIIWF